MTAIAATAGVLGVALGLACLALLVARERQAASTLRDAVTRLGDTEPLRPGVPAALSRLERAVERVQQHDHAADAMLVRLTTALDLMNQGAVVCDAAGAVVTRNAYANRFAQGRHGDVLVDSAVRELLAEARAGRRVDREVELFGPPRRLLYVHAAPLHDPTTRVLIGAVALVDDLTEQQRIDTMRRDFVANISHELKTPVGAMTVLADTLADEDDPAVVARLAGRVRDEAFRLNSIIDDLLALSTIEGTGVPEPEDLAVAAIVAEAVDRTAPAAQHYAVRVEVGDMPAGLGLRGDRRQLVSAVANLLDNAVKYSHPGGAVEVRAAGDEHEVSIVVADHGIGIPARDVDRIFERFYRVDQARSRATGGTGLGLSIVRHVARNHGGEVTVSSREGEGSTFMLVLPAARPSVPDGGQLV